MPKYIVETFATAEIKETWEVTASSKDEAGEEVLMGRLAKRIKDLLARGGFMVVRGVFDKSRP